MLQNQILREIRKEKRKANRKVSIFNNRNIKEEENECYKINLK